MCIAAIVAMGGGPALVQAIRRQALDTVISRNRRGGLSKDLNPHPPAGASTYSLDLNAAENLYLDKGAL